MKVGALCVGYGGIEMGLRLAGEDVDPRWLAEFDQALDPVHPAGVPNLGDITAIDWSAVEPVDLITAGFPCQPFSAAGSQLAEADPRYLWPAVRTGIAALRPPRVLLENVRNLVSMRKGEVWALILDDLGQLGYEVRWLTLGACAVGAAHHRHRVFALAEQVGYETDQVERLDVQECGARSRPSLPTPVVRDADHRGVQTQGRRTSPNLGTELAALLPTPTAGGGTGYMSGTHRDTWRPGLELAVQGHHARKGRPAPGSLLPTPTVAARSSANATAGRRTPMAGHAGHTLTDATRLLPTPRTSDGRGPAVHGEGGNDLRTTVAPVGGPGRGQVGHGGPGQRGSAGDLAMPSAVQPQNWGRFEAAVARHAATFGPPPAPTEPNRNGAPRLAAPFAEWLMCIPSGHVTGVLPRAAALKAIGNGVCPPQLAAAWRYLTGVDRPSDVSLESHDVTTSTLSSDVKQIQDHRAESRGRVIVAGLSAADEPNEEDAARIVQAAMMELAAVWREEAAAFTEAKRRGWKSTAEQRTQAAALLAGFAVGLTTRPTVVSTGTLVIPASEVEEAAAIAAQREGCSHPDNARSTLKSGVIVCTLCNTAVSQVVPPTAPRLDALVPGTVPGPVVTGDPTMDFLTGATDVYEPKDPPAVQPFTAPVAVAIPNPFTSPAAPGRPAVKRLTYGELGPLIAATYPVPRPHLSHSYVESIERCGLSALLGDASRGGHVGPRRPSWSLIGGNAFHAAVEGIERAALNLGGASPDGELGDWETYWVERFNDQINQVRDALAGTPYASIESWHIANKGLEGYDWWRVQGFDMLQRYLKHHDNAWRAQHTLLQVPADPTSPNANGPRLPVIELPFTVSAGSTAITMEGFIDAAWLSTSPDYPTATLEVVDYKAGKSLPADHFQLTEYGDVLRKHLPPNFALPIVGKYWRARLGAYTPPITLHAEHGRVEIDYRYQAAQRAMSHAVFAPRVDNMCSSCGSVDVCPAQAMRDAS